ncbi:MAG: hypothetical protein ACU84Q_08310 [Gammaproteobacteria bacterium]
MNDAPDLIANRPEVRDAIGNEHIESVNALDANEFTGLPPQRYARPGRIPSSTNISFAETVDPDTGEFADDDSLRGIFAAESADDKGGVICSCGGGIAAAIRPRF